MDTAGINKHRFRLIRELFEDIADPVHDQRLHISVQKIILFDRNHRKTIDRSLFRRCQDNAPQTPFCTDKNLMRFRNQHSGVGDVPVKVTVDGKTGAPLSYEIDLTKALEVVTNNVLMELGGGTLEEGIAVKTHVITSTLTQLGNVAAEEIPPAAKSDAINYEKEISLLEEAK